VLMLRRKNLEDTARELVIQKIAVTIQRVL
jgi:hypothetical protein